MIQCVTNKIFRPKYKCKYNRVYTFAKYENKAPGQKKTEVGNAVPFGRMGTAQDLTGMAVFLASNDANYVVAQTYNVDGGSWMS